MPSLLKPRDGSPASPAKPPLSPHERRSAVHAVTAVTEQVGGPEDDAAVAVRPTLDDGPPPVIDDAAESAFLAEARDRGEVVSPQKAAEDVVENDPKSLPPLKDLVDKIPTEVKDVLEDLFRAKFVTVKRFPKKALK